jgi:hypothetical protein
MWFRHARPYSGRTTGTPPPSGGRLDRACEARLLRVSGATYQFRHRELQEFLTAPEGADR